MWTGRRGTRERSAASRAFGPARTGIGFYAVDVKLVSVARKWMSRHAPESAAVHVDRANAQAAGSRRALGRRTDLRRL